MSRDCPAGTDPSRLLRLRGLCWAGVLSHESMVAALCERTAADGWCTNGALMALCAMYRRLREGADEPGAARCDHEAAAERLIAAIVEADAEDLWLDRVIADIVSVHACDPAIAPGWIPYLTSVRAVYFVLNIERRRSEGAGRLLRGLPRG